ncbi:phage tail tape measure protein [Streptomyces sp. NPDC005318]|uniref:phage tail tape measure protein n=1 Tax=Streptomyces sp. NPDC005318 TaxID=3157031 RepID=UPI0033B6EDA3
MLKAYRLTAGDADGVMDIMFQTVNKGVISFEELAQELGDVVPMAAAAGVEFDDMSAALAAITLAGISAAESATALNMMLTRMMQPTEELGKAIKTLGYDSAASAVQQDGLYVVVNKLVKSTHGQAEAITGLFHDVRASRAVLALAAADGKNYAETYAGIANEVERAGATQRAFQMQMDTTAGQWQMFVNRSKALGMDLGWALLPVLQAVGEAVSVFAGALADAPGPLKEIGAGLLAVTAGGMLALVAVTKLTTQWREFHIALAAAQAGQSAMPAVLKGAGLAVSGLTALLAVGVIAYSAYSASKQKAKMATDDLVEALRAEHEQGDEGAGLRALTESLTKSDDAAKLKKVGIDMTDALDAITTGGQKLERLPDQGRADAFRAGALDDAVDELVPRVGLAVAGRVVLVVVGGGVHASPPPLTTSMNCRSRSASREPVSFIRSWRRRTASSASETWSSIRGMGVPPGLPQVAVIPPAPGVADGSSAAGVSASVAAGAGARPNRWSVLAHRFSYASPAALRDSSSSSGCRSAVLTTTSVIRDGFMR